MAETIDIRELNERIERQSAFVTNLTTGMDQVIVGQKHLVESLLIGLLSDGHVLLEGVPGLAKTLAIKTLASLIDAQYSRIQFTPDLLPADVIGTMVYSQKDETFQVKKGPVFANFVLADEINRAPAKVQSALLEAMQERQVTIGNETFGLPKPFLVLATQNPIEQEGTYPLPEAQVDRFMLKVVIDYPKQEEEKLIIRQNINGEKFNVKPILKADEIIEARKVVRQVYLDEKIEKYIVDIVFATRYPEKYDLKELKDMIGFGGSPRASINLALAARSYAFIKRRGYVIPEDVRAVAHDVLRHRIGLTYEAEASNMTSDETFQVKKGPVFANFVLADEINRAPAKVQSALLEAMQERQVTIGNETFGLPKPFLVLATQNPIEQEGTYPLPEAQVDRFMLKVVIDYPKQEEEKLIIRQNINGEKFNVKPILKADEIIEARKVVRQVYLDEKIEKYIVDIVFATRYPEKYDLKELKDMIGFGGSPRASINLALAARSYAFIKRRGYVIPEDVRAVAHDVLRHRIGLTYEAEASNMTSDEIVSKILNKVEVP